MRYSPPRLAVSNAVAIAETLKSISGGRVLDVATGGGEFVSLLMKILKNYYCDSQWRCS
jgi:ubiquinone/menaquinone biosynthesis C-methylase UbiE